MQNTVHTMVAGRLATIVPVVTDKVVDVLVGREVQKRSDAMVKVIDLLDQQEKALSKIRPDQLQHDEKGTVLSSTYSKQRLDEKKKAEAAVERTTKAITVALEKGDFNEVYKLAANPNAGGKPESEGSTEG